MIDKSVKIEGDSQAPIITGDGNTLYLSTSKPQTLQEAITTWISQTKINLSLNLVLKSREKQIAQFLDLLTQSPSKIIIVSSSEQESYIFIVASLKDSQEYADRVKVVTSQESWESLIKEENLILVYQGFTPNNIGGSCNPRSLCN